MSSNQVDDRNQYIAKKNWKSVIAVVHESSVGHDFEFKETSSFKET